MFINIRGTSGAGKTTIMVRLLSRFKTREPVLFPGRKQPLYYKCWVGEPSGPPDLIVLGHYETECGGCDTIHSMDEIFDLVVSLSREAPYVLFEGMMLSHIYGRAFDLSAQVNGLFITLDTTVEQCIASVNERRERKGKGGVDPYHITHKHRSVLLSHNKMVETGMPAEMLDREAAYWRVIDLMFL